MVLENAINDASPAPGSNLPTGTNLSLIGLMSDGKAPPPVKPTNCDLADFLEHVPERLHINQDKNIRITPAMLKQAETSDLTPYEKLMLQVAEKHFDDLAHLTSPGKKEPKGSLAAVSNGVRSGVYSGQSGDKGAKATMWEKYGAINEDDIRALRVLDLERIKSDAVEVCSAKARGKGALLGTIGEVAWLAGGGPLAWTSTGLTTGFDMMKSHGGAPGLQSVDRGGAIGAQIAQKGAAGKCGKEFDQKELPKIQGLIDDLDADDFYKLEARADSGDPEAIYKYGKALKAYGDYRTVDNMAAQQNHREDRSNLRLGGEELQRQAASLGSASAKLDSAKILIRSSDDKDRQQAMEYFEAAVKADARGAKAAYGEVLVEAGSSTSDNASVFKGLSLLESATKSGDLVALGELRIIYSKGVAVPGQDGFILPPNPTRVAELDGYVKGQGQSPPETVASGN